MTEFNKLSEAKYEISKTGAMKVPVRLYATEKLQEQMKQIERSGRLRTWLSFQE